MGNKRKQHDYLSHSHAQRNMTSRSVGHGSAQVFLRRFWIVTFLLIPLLLANEAVTGFLGITPLPFSKWIGFGIATVIFVFSLIFFQHAWHEVKTRKYGMMMLVSLAVGTGYIFSVASTFLTALDVEFYLEISTLVWVLLFGHYLEARSSAAAGNALQEVAKLLPQKAHWVRDDNIEEVDVSDLVKGDVVLVKPGEKIPADGEIIEGSANVDESLISGESRPVEKAKGDSAVAGSICIDGSLTIRLSRVGENSTIGQIQKLVAEAQQTKPRSQRIADKAAAILTFTAGVTALLTILVWTIVIGQPFVFAMTLAITVLVIACPHALGLAIPTVTTITTSLAVKNGIFIKDLSKIEIVRKADYIVFDKTGTLTKGEFGVTDVIPIDSHVEEEVLQIAASIDQHSSHVVAKSIVEAAKARGIQLKNIADFENISGRGVRAKIEGATFMAGNKAFMEESGVFTKKAENMYTSLAAKGRTISFIASKEMVLGLIGLADEIKQDSRKAIDELHKMDIKTAILTGDDEEVAKNVASELAVDSYFAEVLPEDKYKHVRALQKEGYTVLMVGDGVNDAPALTQANVGIAVGAGTDVAVEAGDVVLTRSNPEDVVHFIVLAKKVYRKMIQNLVWALGYNIVAIPTAAGVFAAWGFFLRPEVGALVMSLSTVIVVVNAMMLRRAKL